MTGIPLTVGATEAERDFRELLDRVAVGEEFTITQHGEPVARLIPAQRVCMTKSRAAVIQRLRNLASRNTLGGLQVRQLLAEGRK